MCQQCERQAERDRAFWKTVRRALLMVAKAIESRYTDPKQQDRRAA